MDGRLTASQARESPSFATARGGRFAAERPRTCRERHRGARTEESVHVDRCEDPPPNILARRQPPSELDEYLEMPPYSCVEKI